MEKVEQGAKITPDGLAAAAAILAGRRTLFATRKGLIATFWHIFDKLVEDQQVARETLEKEEMCSTAVRLSKEGWGEDDIRALRRLSVRVRRTLEHGYELRKITPPLNTLTDQQLLGVRNFGLGALREFRAVITQRS